MAHSKLVIVNSLETESALPDSNTPTWVSLWGKDTGSQEEIIKQALFPDGKREKGRIQAAAHLLVAADICGSVCSRIYQELETSDSYPAAKIQQ